ncbi:GST N-terminal domain-containing protein [Mycena venus]|uniref:GST N-terminal domain-containing protein n=1 Tax=Mycena venus TaxID=2733690 RepID=A0A8H6YSC6_9AGAR|nr:GST N-terminal domain-containing protein [Mycena venus]
MSSDPIILYDIPSKAPGCAWSPNTWKVRYAFNYKGLAYKTVWIEYPDIADLCKKIGAEPTMIRQNGEPYYSLPVIEDPKTGAVISDSARIAEYLDATYPDTPKVVPEGTHVLQKTFMAAYDNATGPLISYIMPAIAKILRPKSEEYFVRTREASFKKKLTDMWPTGEEHEKAWKEVEAGFGKVDRWLNEPMNAGKPFVMGDVVSFADFMIGGELIWCRCGFGEESDLWKDMMKWHGGRWAKLIDSLKKYEGPLEDMAD